jgi:hypothetical protein
MSEEEDGSFVFYLLSNKISRIKLTKAVQAWPCIIPWAIMTESCEAFNLNDGRLGCRRMPPIRRVAGRRVPVVCGSQVRGSFSLPVCFNYQRLLDQRRPVQHCVSTHCETIQRALLLYTTARLTGLGWRMPQSSGLYCRVLKVYQACYLSRHGAL